MRGLCKGTSVSLIDWVSWKLFIKWLRARPKIFRVLLQL